MIIRGGGGRANKSIKPINLAYNHALMGSSINSNQASAEESVIEGTQVHIFKRENKGDKDQL